MPEEPTFPTSPKRPRSFRSFWWHGLKKAGKKSWEKYEKAIIVFGLIYTLLAIVLCHSKFADEKPEGMDMSTWVLFVIPAALLIFFLFWHLVVAPYEIYKETWQKHQEETNELSKKLATAESKIEQFLNQRAPLLMTCRSNNNNCEIILTNPNLTQGIDGVELSLIEISPPIPRFMIADTTAAFNPAGIQFGSYSMSNQWLTGQQTAFFIVFYIQELQPHKIFRFYGQLSDAPEAIWENFNNFSPKVGEAYQFTFEARGRGIIKGTKRFKFVLQKSGSEPKFIFEEIN